MDSSQQVFKIWQWNCNSFTKKKSSLAQLLRSCKQKPHVIHLQECGDNESLRSLTFPGYRVTRPTLCPDFKQARGIATLVRKDLSFVERTTPAYKQGLESQLVEIIPGRATKSNIFLLNVYSPPRDRLRNFNSLFLAATKQAKDKPLIIAGDFNAHNKAWGYSKNDGKGNKLAECAEILGLKLITDPRFPTRKGNSAQRDTTPDLAFLRNVEGSWDNLQEDLGSDHFITEINVSITQPPPKIYKYIDWDVFRDIRTKEERPRETFEDLISNLKEAVHKATKEISTELELAVPAMDSRLAHLLEAKNALSERWKRQKMNRRLRTKISELNKEIETHAKKLAAQQWDEVCNEADGKMRKGSKWSLLKHLLTDGNKPSKSSARLEIERLVHMNTKDGGDPQTFADKLADI